jgi:hypothetical protein
VHDLATIEEVLHEVEMTHKVLAAQRAEIDPLERLGFVPEGVTPLGLPSVEKLLRETGRDRLLGHAGPSAQRWHDPCCDPHHP